MSLTPIADAVANLEHEARDLRYAVKNNTSPQTADMLPTERVVVMKNQLAELIVAVRNCKTAGLVITGPAGACTFKDLMPQ